MAHSQTNSSQEGSSGTEFSVAIVASAVAQDGGLLHAIAVAQPVQSWTVLRSHEDFVSVGGALSHLLPGLPPCPSAPTDAGDDMNVLVKTRNSLQEWLMAILTYPGARESPAMRHFLTYGANMIPSQFEGVSWMNFSQQQQQQPQAAIMQNHPSTSAASKSGAGGGGGSNAALDDMEMDDMFLVDDDDGGGGMHDESDDEDDFLQASQRYKPTEEAITHEEEEEIMQLAGEVEMIQDVGSLAQSLGASHLGRSLQLQAQIGKRDDQPKAAAENKQMQGGIALDVMNHKTMTGGGIGGAMEQAVNSNNSFQGETFPRSTTLSPPRLDSFKMIKVIGKGSFGKVYLVKEIKTGDMYALKVLRKDNIIKRNQVEHTKTERNVLGYVKHPFIVGMNMAFQSKDKLYFVLDYCAGGELFFHLGKLGKFPEPRARFYAAEIVLAISYVHSLDIIYRDLKPENVLLDARGHIRLTDFGLSKEGISSSSSGANSFCGTPEYLAPEILNRQGHGRAVDWWSLGALLYEMLTGLPPFYCQDRERLFEKIRKSELHYPASLSRPAKYVLRGLLTRDPSTRLGSGPGDAEDIKCHEFFSDIDWDELATGETATPWRPQISNSLDTSQFDKEFTSMPIFSPQSLKGFGKTPQDNPFEGFTFTDRTLQGPSAGN